MNSGAYRTLDESTHISLYDQIYLEDDNMFHTYNNTHQARSLRRSCRETEVSELGTSAADDDDDSTEPERETDICKSKSRVYMRNKSNAGNSVFKQQAIITEINAFNALSPLDKPNQITIDDTNHDDTTTPETKSGETFIRQSDNDCQCDVQEICDIKSCRYFTRQKGKIFLKECAVENGVAVQYEAVLPCCSGKLALHDEYSTFPDGTISAKTKWFEKQPNSLQLLFQRSSELQEQTKVVNVKFGEKSYGAAIKAFPTSNGLSVVVNVPDWSRGCKARLTDQLRRVFSMCESHEPITYILTVYSTLNWKQYAFIYTLLRTSVQIVFDTEDSDCVKTVCVALKDQELFHIAARHTRRCLKEYLREKQYEKKQLRILVIEGEISKTKADVVVNTTSRNLELTNGKVSATLLKAAGHEIQAECRFKYPDGISSFQVAVTDGYRLPCQKVFHLALDQFSQETSNESVERIRRLVYICLEMANTLAMTTIAFPALGAGTLRYPIDLVGAAMFEGVERFRESFPETSLKEVYFVIFYSDKKVMREFRKHEEVLATPQDKTFITMEDTTVKLKISGQAEKVSKAGKRISEKAKVLHHNRDNKVIKDIPNMSKIDLIGLLGVCTSSLDSITNRGVSLFHDFDSMKLIGKRGLLEDEVNEIMELLVSKRRDLSLMKHVVIALEDYDTKAVENAVRLMNQSDHSVRCVFDRYCNLIYIYSNVSISAEEMTQTLQQKIILRLGTET